jgi:hypothetical protein
MKSGNIELRITRMTLMSFVEAPYERRNPAVTGGDDPGQGT